MKANKKKDWIPKWQKTMDKIKIKYMGNWITKPRPAPSYPPDLSNYQRNVMRKQYRDKQND